MGRNKFSIRKKWLETFEKNNVTIALNVLNAEKGTIYLSYVSKRNSNREKQVILFMIPNGKGCKAKFKGHKAKSQGQQQWHYLAVKRLSTLLRGIISKHHRDSFCLNCLHLFSTEKETLIAWTCMWK